MQIEPVWTALKNEHTSRGIELDLTSLPNLISIGSLTGTLGLLVYTVLDRRQQVTVEQSRDSEKLKALERRVNLIEEKVLEHSDDIADIKVIAEQVQGLDRLMVANHSSMARQISQIQRTVNAVISRNGSGPLN